MKFFYSYYNNHLQLIIISYIIHNHKITVLIILYIITEKINFIQFVKESNRQYIHTFFYQGYTTFIGGLI